MPCRPEQMAVDRSLATYALVMITPLLLELERCQERWARRLLCFRPFSEQRSLSEINSVQSRVSLLTTSRSHKNKGLLIL